MNNNAIRQLTFDAGPARIAYIEGPASGPPLVLLHGGSTRLGRELYGALLNAAPPGGPVNHGDAGALPVLGGSLWTMLEVTARPSRLQARRAARPC